jgi:two-component system chemotaxis sensor kinase CheA
VGIVSRPGAGTTFLLKVPLTLAIIKALMFRVDERLYALPLNAVAEISRARECDVHRVDGHEVLQLRKEVLTLLRLGRQQADSNPERKFFVVIITVAEKKFGLMVDELVGEEELVIKPLDDHVVATDLVSGASILGNGTVVLVLNLGAVVDRFARRRPAEHGALAAGLLTPRSLQATAAGGGAS